METHKIARKRQFWHFIKQELKKLSPLLYFVLVYPPSILTKFIPSQILELTLHYFI